MATVPSSSSLKRSSPLSSSDALASKKRRKVSTHHHYLHHSARSPLTPTNAEIIHSLLERAITLILTAAGYNGANPDALQFFRVHVEEYMIHQLSNISISMTSSRRTQPIPPDFDFVLRKQNLSLSSLEPHLQSLVPPSISQRFLPTPPPEDPPNLPLSPVLGPVLSGAPDKQRAPYVPTHFPSFPSKHTYKTTPEFTERERDPRKVRERATEEGRLGEEALRRLLGAAGGGGHGTSDNFGLRSANRRQRDRMWERTVDALIKGVGIANLSNGESGIGASQASVVDNSLAVGITQEFGVVVNSEKDYWRKGAVSTQDSLRRRRNGTVVIDSGGIPTSGAGLISAP
ncbi:hypothetical protein FGG08_004480 [Glutinoglossum americanum]|uniref:Transcription initiation factor TFIID subunit 8 n=1 Tax=Glutinoglossum americanum TaxID=1670608 RepID=A0A9P8KX17_9PEZI|nr:hypothetical protein FGG08_004480 [Glutinoglossum americanum]